MGMFWCRLTFSSRSSRERFVGFGRIHYGLTDNNSNAKAHLKMKNPRLLSHVPETRISCYHHTTVAFPMTLPEPMRPPPITVTWLTAAIVRADVLNPAINWGRFNYFPHSRQPLSLSKSIIDVSYLYSPLKDTCDKKLAMVTTRVQPLFSERSFSNNNYTQAIVAVLCSVHIYLHKLLPWKIKKHFF